MVSYIKLNNFRKHENLELKFNKNKVFLKGENAVGKTSILEAIYFALTMRSFRTHNTNDLIKWESPFLKISLNILDKEIEVVKTRETKRILVNKVKVNKVSEYLGLIPVVAYSKEDLKIIALSPGIRREYFDFSIMQLDKRYANLINTYRKIIKERNALLKNITKNSDDTFLNIITKKLYKVGKEITSIRKNYNDSLEKVLNNISQPYFNFKIKVSYLPDLKDLSFDNIKRNYKKEIEYGQTMFGPQKDDYKFYYNDMEIKTFASSGEMQMLLLKLKYAQIKILNSNNTIFLIDDISNTLDSNNINKIIDSMPSNLNIIITDTRFDFCNNLDFQKIIIKKVG